MNIETLKQCRHDYPFLPVTVTLPVTHFDSFSILHHFDPYEQRSMLFTRNEVTTVIVNPLATITGRNGEVDVDQKAGPSETITQSPIEYLKQLYHRHRMPNLTPDNSFTNGLIGYFSYDFIRYAQDVHLAPAPDKLTLPDFDLLLPDVVINYNRDTQTMTLSQAVASDRLTEQFTPVQSRLMQLADDLKDIMQTPVTFLPATTKHFQNQFSLAEFESRVQIAQQHIHAGDIFQLILSNPYLTEAEPSLARVAADLAAHVEAPYHFYFRHGDYQATGASPETLIKKTGSRLFSYPLAGTRRRGLTVAEDEHMAHELMNSEKELAEHNMLVDLGRNDLGRVSEFGSVRVTKLRKLLKFSNVMHLGSTIESTAKSTLTPLDILSATLPAGTLSGAPKISAMQIINRLEQRKRGIYGGGIGMIDFAGDMDICIGIRLAYQTHGVLVVHSGAGIVADSIAEQEYHEFENKSRLMMDAIQKGVVPHVITD